MSSIFNMDNKFFSAMSKIADLIILNILWTICSVPIITIGATTTALYYVTLKMVKNEESYIVKSFFKSFIQNFKQATGIWIMILAAGGILLGDVFILSKWDTRFKTPLMVVFIAIFLVVFLVFLYVFPLLAQFDNTIKQTIKNSFLMSIRHLPKTLVIFLITVVLLVACSLTSTTMFVAFMIGISGIAYLNSLFLTKVFAMYMPDESDEIVSDDNFTADAADRGDYSVFTNPMAGKSFDSTASLMESLNEHQNDSSSDTENESSETDKDNL